MELDKSDFNYNGVFDCDMKMAVLQYLLDKSKRTGRQPRTSAPAKLANGNNSGPGKVENGFD